MYFDAAAFCGNWPYYRLEDSDPAKMLEKLKKEGIEGGFLSSLDAIFYNDPWEADGPLIASVRETEWKVAMCVNPTLPWAEELLCQGKEQGAGAVRLYPCIHGYQEDDECAVAICRLAGQLGLPVLMTLRVEDVRMAYLLQQAEPDLQRVGNLIRRCGDTKFVISNCMVHQVEELPQSRNVWFDTAGFKGDFYLEQQNRIDPDRILFGSFAPLQCLSSALLNIPEGSKTAVMMENTKELYK